MKKLCTILFACCIFQIINAQVVVPNYEFRAVWVATVENIDWPSNKNLSVEQQKAEFINLLDMHQRNGMNAIIMQVRPAADAFYPSKFEPWSEYLTGKQGLAPEPYYDPLDFMINETHKRGMEFHAWLNPYRAVFNILKSSIAPNHITRKHPEWFLTYGSTKYFNPSLPEVRQHTASVIKDLVTRYNLDGIHMDDYFYPYPIEGKEFPDQADYLKFGNGLNKDDWRRSNCDSIILLIHNTVRSVNPHVKFGVSPFGVWRNKSKDPMGSDTKAGPTNYDVLYADILLWLQKGWIDYVVPQLYWERGHKLVDYDTILDWWNKNTYGKHLYIGHGIYRAGTNLSWKSPKEIPDQLQRLRAYPTTQGSV
ncbi:MAG: family 10 glycosylhydrolase, partial [Sediminibacterium sp.]